MATEATHPVNGNYGAASQTSSQSANLANGTSEPVSSPQTGKDEVGWYFVEQYYTTMSRSPEKVHLFYNKRSQFVYGVEAEKVPVSVGQKAINERIAELGIEDCKVRVTNVDSQESGKSIVLQVIGEMSVKGQPHRKFAQTFVLAEQPNGYFVLNDIFRYIADEPEDDDELEAVVEAPAAEPAEPQEEPKILSSDNLVEQARAAEVVNKKLEEVASEEKPTVEDTSVEEPVVTEAGPVEETAPESDVAEVDATESVASAALEPEKPKDPEPTPAITPAPVAAQAPPPKAAPAPTPAPAPAKPKTWASMLAANKAPPAVPIIPATPATQAPSQPKAAPVATPSAPAAAQAAPTANQVSANDAEVPASPGGWQSVGQDHNKKNNRTQNQIQGNQPQGVTNAYIKNVTDKIEQQALKTHLEQYGKVHYIDVSRQKNAAFIEFETLAGFNAAVASNPHKINGEEIFVEERRPRGNNFPNNFRGGPRGGQGGPRGAPRGGFVPRGRGVPGGARGRGGAPVA